MKTFKGRDMQKPFIKVTRLTFASPNIQIFNLIWFLQSYCFYNRLIFFLSRPSRISIKLYFQNTFKSQKQRIKIYYFKVLGILDSENLKF